MAGEPVIDRAFRLLGSFRAEDTALSLAALSARSALPKATALRLIRRLTEVGALEQLADGSYVLGLRLLELASLAPRGHGLRLAALPHMQALQAETGHHVLLAVRDGHASVLVERLSAHQAGTLMYRVGGRMPLHATGVGLVLLAYADAATQREVLNRPLPLDPEGTEVTADAVRRRLNLVRRRGVAVMARREPEHLASLAAPVHQHDQVAAAVSVLAPEGQLQPRDLEALVRAAARAISCDLTAAAQRQRKAGPS